MLYGDLTQSEWPLMLEQVAKTNIPLVYSIA